MVYGQCTIYHLIVRLPISELNAKGIYKNCVFFYIFHFVYFRINFMSCINQKQNNLSKYSFEIKLYDKKIINGDITDSIWGQFCRYVNLLDEHSNQGLVNFVRKTSPKIADTSTQAIFLLNLALKCRYRYAASWGTGFHPYASPCDNISK